MSWRLCDVKNTAVADTIIAPHGTAICSIPNTSEKKEVLVVRILATARYVDVPLNAGAWGRKPAVFQGIEDASGLSRNSAENGFQRWCGRRRRRRPANPRMGAGAQG